MRVKNNDNKIGSGWIPKLRAIPVRVLTQMAQCFQYYDSIDFKFSFNFTVDQANTLVTQ